MTVSPQLIYVQELVGAQKRLNVLSPPALPRRGDILRADATFYLRSLSPVKGSIEPLNTRSVCCARRFRRHALRDVFHLRQSEGAIQQEEGLRGDGGGDTLLCDTRRIGDIEERAEPAPL